MARGFDTEEIKVSKPGLRRVPKLFMEFLGKIVEGRQVICGFSLPLFHGLILALSHPSPPWQKTMEHTQGLAHFSCVCRDTVHKSSDSADAV